MSDQLILSLFAAVLIGLFLLLRRRDRGAPPSKTRRGKRPKIKRPHAVVDGSNVMHWNENKPQLGPVKAALDALDKRGYHAGVIFDANAGYKLAGRHLNDAALAKMLHMPKDRVLVVPKGSQADPFLLSYANDANAIVVSNDRFRDRIGDYPKLAKPGRLIQGGWQDGRIWLDLPKS